VRIVKSKYLSLSIAGTTKPQVDARGVKYWVLTDPSRNITEHSSVTLAIKVSPLIPGHKASCVLTTVEAKAPGYDVKYPAGKGSCRPGLEWARSFQN
jgi:hypothetical protein